MSIAQDFKTGDLVTYLPYHAKGDFSHPDVEHGRVTSENGIFVFVRFDGEIHAKACHPATLRHQWMPSTSQKCSERT